jgi:hypothetical protein
VWTPTTFKMAVNMFRMPGEGGGPEAEAGFGARNGDFDVI